METMTDFIFLGSKITAGGDCKHDTSPGKKRYDKPAAAAAWLQACPTLCDPIDGSPLGSSVPGALQARIREWVAISFSMTNLDSTLKSRDIILLTKIHRVKAMVMVIHL